jgi:UDP-N-acetylglucosamine transferase subunit ALG13
VSKLINFRDLLFLGIVLASLEGRATPSPIRPTSPQDIAIILPPTPDPQRRISMGGTLFPEAWWNASLKLYETTTVGTAVSSENSLKDWQLVSLRFAPCQPLFPYLTPVNEFFCAAEIRLVWQPFLYARLSQWTYEGDDRAFHVTYRLKGTHALTSEEAKKYLDLQKNPNPTATQVALYDFLHQKVVAKTLGDLKNLAAVPPANDLQARLEFQSSDLGKQFRDQLAHFLSQQAVPNQVAEVTGFSLPEGRDPPLLDDWVFVAFAPAQDGQHLDPKNILLKSTHDGRVLLDFGPATSVSMHQDDTRIFDMMSQLGEADQKEVENHTILNFKEKRTKRSLIADSKSVHVSHTTCGSCHKLNAQPFDFHNLSYFKAHEVTISPRVHQDVRRDLQWLKSRELTQ